MHILLPNSPINRKEVDEDYHLEQDAARGAGFETALYSHEALEADERDAVFVRRAEGRDYLLRGWMLTGDEYALLCASAEEQGSRLLTSPAAYAEAHYLPLGYHHLHGETPESRWMQGDDPDAAWQLYLPFQDEDAIIKDWVKSAKHRWREACYLPGGTTRDRFREIYGNFRQARGHLFNRGVVIKRFVRLANRGEDMRGFPRVEEHRLFYFRGQLLAWPEGDHAPSPLVEIERWNGIAGRFASPFLTLDVALLEAGGWTVIEAGDGGVSGLPTSIDPASFYQKLWKLVGVAWPPSRYAAPRL
jgi:hypothetical protein